MRITRLQIKNGYKRFHDLAIELGNNPARIVALVGPNGCGKSSVLDALLFHANAHEWLGAGDSRDSSYHSMTGRPVDFDDIEIQFSTGRFVDVRESKRKAGTTNTFFAFRGSCRYNSELKIRETRAVPEIKQNSYGASDASSLDEKMEENYRRLAAHYNNHRDTKDLKPSEAKANIIGELNTSIKNGLDIEVSSPGNVESGQGTLYFSKPDHPQDFAFNVLSSGEKEVVDLLLDLYLRGEDCSDSVFLLDEPELCIGTAPQGKLLVEIDRLVGDDCRIWLTTHSIGFLRALQTRARDGCQIIHFHPEPNRAAEVHTLKPTHIRPGTWRTLFATAPDDPAHPVGPSTVIPCEAVTTIFAKTHPDTVFVSSGGPTELDQRWAMAMAIPGKAFPDMEIGVLKDRAMAAGPAAGEPDCQVHLSTNPLDHRVLRRREIENDLHDRDVLRACCVAMTLPFDEEACDACVPASTTRPSKTPPAGSRQSVAENPASVPTHSGLRLPSIGSPAWRLLSN